LEVFFYYSTISLDTQKQCLQWGKHPRLGLTFAEHLHTQNIKDMKEKGNPSSIEYLIQTGHLSCHTFSTCNKLFIQCSPGNLVEYLSYSDN